MNSTVLRSYRSAERARDTIEQFWAPLRSAEQLNEADPASRLRPVLEPEVFDFLSPRGMPLISRPLGYKYEKSETNQINSSQKRNR